MKLTIPQMQRLADVTLDLSDDYGGEFDIVEAYFDCDDESPASMIGWCVGGLALTPDDAVSAMGKWWITMLERIAKEQWDEGHTSRQVRDE